MSQRIDLSKLSLSTIERMRVYAMQTYGVPLDEDDFAEVTDEAMARLSAESEKTGETVPEILDRLSRKLSI